MRRNIPPDGEADEYGVIFVHIRQPLGNGGAGGGVIHFDAAVAVFVHPVEVGPVEVGVRIGDGRISNSSAPAALAKRSAACRVTPLAEKYATSFLLISIFLQIMIYLLADRLAPLGGGAVAGQLDGNV